MIWSSIMHALIGLFGITIFTLTPKGVVLAVLVACATQGSEMWRIHRETKRQIGEGPAKEREARLEEFQRNWPSMLKKLYPQKVIICSLITLVVAQLGRTYGIGI